MDIRQLEKRQPISIEDALQIILKHSTRGMTETVPLSEADSRYLAEDLIADHSVPLFDRSMYDGYALRAEDTCMNKPGHDVSLSVVGSIAAGETYATTLQAGETVRIMTGAPLPEGANAVIMLEDVQHSEAENGQTVITFQKSLHRDENVSKKGEDIQEGTVLVHSGTRIGAAEKALLATFGYAHVRVYEKPKVAIFATGSELLAVDDPLVAGKIRNSNSYMLESQLRQMGAQPTNLGILHDDLNLCFQAINKTFNEYNYIITTGGAAVGDYDFVQDIIQKLQAEKLFDKVSMRPGSVTTVAYREDGKWMFGLSGNPAACFVGAELFVRPCLKTALGATQTQLQKEKAKLHVDIDSVNNFPRLMRAQLHKNGTETYVQPVGLDRSGVISSLVKANALLIVPAHKRLQKGEEVEVMLLDREGGSHHA